MSTVAKSANTVQMHHTLFADAVHQVSAIAHAKLPESLHGPPRACHGARP
jgi:hypothetical protein